ncbi:response regulator transcription factor [Variovorax sp. J22P271]|uniref:response regulator n=1 Tax=Variovorax davisae TaxID=3053515 RepID=UPI002576226C|nr:response regulator transcription factor [Variovorax sp. J22P271]MDM0031968.1 response regulator transcription factor [Variovorax sp. J22P271]
MESRHPGNCGKLRQVAQHAAERRILCREIDFAHLVHPQSGAPSPQDRENMRKVQVVKVLLVDDSEAIRESFGALLATAPGVEVVGCAEDVASALAAIASTRPDLIVLDARLRGLDKGIDVLRHVRQNYSDIQVIVLSAFSWASMRKRHMDAGAVAYFDKSTEFSQARDWIVALSSARSIKASTDRS